MSSFAIAGVGTATFTVQDRPYGERYTPLRTIEASLYLASAAQVTTLRTLRSWQVSQRPIPSGTPYLQVGGGPGTGTLVIDGVGTLTAALDAERGWSVEEMIPGGAVVVRASFVVTS